MKVLGIAASGLVVYTLIVHPDELGDAAQIVGGWVKEGGSAVLTFLRSVFN